MWVPLEAITEPFSETGGRWLSRPFFTGKIFSPLPNFPHPRDLSFLHHSLVVDISSAIRDYQEPGCSFDQKSNDMSLFRHPLVCHFSALI
jgi:hypothetical protein